MSDSLESAIGLEEAARALRIAPSTLRKRAAAGLVSGMKRSGRWFFFAADIRAYFDQFRNDAPIAPRSEFVLKEIGLLRHVYVIPCGAFVKVGVARDVAARWRALSAANPMIEPVLYQTPALRDAWEIERAAHEELSSYRANGEWFRCDRSVAVAVVRRLARDFA